MIVMLTKMDNSYYQKGINMNRLCKALWGATTLISISILFTSNVKAGTGIYIGRDVSCDDTTIIAGNTDDAEDARSVVSIVSKNDSATSISAANGFVYELPSQKYQYQLIKNMDASVETTATNEYGLAVSLFESVSTNEKAMEADPFVQKGLDRSILASLVASSCRSSQEAVELVASIIDKSGCSEGMILMVADQREAWYMEMYTGHQYAAVKLPRDVVAVFGDDYSISGVLSEYDNYIISSNLLSLPEENEFIKYNKNGEIDLHSTYANAEGYSNNDNLKKWIARKVFNSEDQSAYSSNTEYDLYFTPDCTVNCESVFSLLRNRYEDTNYENDGSYAAENQTIGNQKVSESHVIQIVSNAPAKMADVMWVNLSQPNYAPYLPLSNIVEELPQQFTHVVEDNGYYEDSASYSFGKINAISNRDSINVGKGIREYYENIEALYLSLTCDKLQYEWTDLYNESPEEARKSIADYTVDLFKKTFEDSKKICDDAIWYMMNTDTSNSEESESITDETVEGETAIKSGFVIGFDLKEYAELLGWEYVESEAGILLSRGDDNIILKYNEDNNYESEMIVSAPESYDEEEVESEEAMAAGNIPEVNIDLTIEIPQEVEDEVSSIRSALDGDFADYIAEKIDSVPDDGISKTDLLGIIEDMKNNLLELVSIEFSHYVEDVPFEEFADDDVRQQASMVFEIVEGKVAELVEAYFDRVISSVKNDLTKENLTKDEAQAILTGLNDDIEGIVGDYLSTDITTLIAESIDVEKIEDILNETATALANVVEKYTGFAVSDISDEEVLAFFENMDPEIKEGLGELFGVDIDAAIIDFKNSMDEKDVSNEDDGTDVDSNDDAEENSDAEDDKYYEEYELSDEAIKILEEALAGEYASDDDSDETHSDEADTKRDEEDALPPSEALEEEENGKPSDEEIDEESDVTSGESYKLYMYKANGKIYVSPQLMKILIKGSKTL